jgi:hypothetical protein
VTKVVGFVFKTLSPLLVRDCAGTKKLGDNVVDFLFKALSQSSRSLGYVGDKPCWQSVVDETLSLIVTSLTRFPKGILPTGLSGSCP